MRHSFILYNSQMYSIAIREILANKAPVNSVWMTGNKFSVSEISLYCMCLMCCDWQVVRVLLSDWEADPEARDYSGRRAIQYLPPPLAADLQEEGVVISPGAESDNENTTSSSSSSGGGRGWRFPRVLQGNLNPLRLLNPPAEAAEDAAATGRTKGGIQRKSSLSRLNARLHRGRHRAQIIHSASFRDTGEVGRGEELPSSPLRTRPLSNLFGWSYTTLSQRYWDINRSDMF